MKQLAFYVAVGLSAAALSFAVPGTATAAVPCGDHWSPRPEGPNARDYEWGNCTGAATLVDVYSLTYGGAFRTFLRQECVGPDQEIRLGSTTDFRVLSYTGEDTGNAC